MCAFSIREDRDRGESVQGDLAAARRASVTADFGSVRRPSSMVCGACLPAWRFNLKWELALGRTAGQIDWQTVRRTDRSSQRVGREEGARWTAKSPLMSLIKKEGMKEGREGAAAS